MCCLSFLTKYIFAIIYHPKIEFPVLSSGLQSHPSLGQIRYFGYVFLFEIKLLSPSSNKKEFTKSTIHTNSKKSPNTLIAKEQTINIQYSLNNNNKKDFFLLFLSSSHLFFFTVFLQQLTHLILIKILLRIFGKECFYSLSI